MNIEIKRQTQHVQEHSKNKATLNNKKDKRNDFIYMEMMFTR